MSDVQLNVASDGTRLAPDVLMLLQRLEVRESDSEPTVASLRFGLAQAADGRWRPIDDGPFTPASPLELDVAAPGGLPTRLFSGFVTHLRPHFETIEANCYVEILAMDHAALMDAHERVASYPDMSDSDAVGEILSRYQLHGELGNAPVHHELERELLIQRGSDWNFVRKLARRNGFVFYFEHDEQRGEVVAHFEPPRFADTPQADIIIQQDGANLRWADLQFRMTGPTRQTGAAIDVLEKRIIRADGEANAIKLGADSTTELIDAALAGRGIDQASALVRDPEQADAGLAAQASAASNELGHAVELQGELDPAVYRGLLRARRPVLVRGLGERFSGTYFVRVVRTVVDAGALTQTFMATRNALAQDGGEAFGQSAEEIPPR
jgi:phage protein D